MFGAHDLWRAGCADSVGESVTSPADASVDMDDVETCLCHPAPELGIIAGREDFDGEAEDGGALQKAGWEPGADNHVVVDAEALGQCQHMFAEAGGSCAVGGQKDSFRCRVVVGTVAGCQEAVPVIRASAGKDGRR